MDYIKITFADLQPEQKEILIAQLADAGYEGFEEVDNSLDAFINSKSFDTVILNEISFKIIVSKLSLFMKASRLVSFSSKPS